MSQCTLKYGYKLFLASRITEQPGGLKIDERIGYTKKVMSIKFDESYDYSDEGMLEPSRKNNSFERGMGIAFFFMPHITLISGSRY